LEDGRVASRGPITGVALRRGQWRSLEALQMPEHSDAILADAPPGVPRASQKFACTFYEFGM